MPSLWLGFDVSYVMWYGASQPAGAGSDAGAPARAGFASGALLLMLTAAVDWKL